MANRGHRAGTVVIKRYSPQWPLIYAHLHDALHPAFAPLAVHVEHIGSTSVPHLAAKPVIDILLGATSLKAIESRIAALARIGYTYVPDHERVLPERRYFVKTLPSSVRVHLHAVEFGSRFWCEHLAFRDALRSHSDLRVRYEKLKRALAVKYKRDKAAYTTAKGAFIQSVLAGGSGRPGDDGAEGDTPFGDPEI